MSAGCPHALAMAAWMVAALAAAGVVHVQWLRSRAARRFSRPLDGGATFRGRRLFGPNKMLRGLVAMPPAGAASFLLLGLLHREASVSCGLWSMDVTEYAMLGFACGLAFMLAELPNSFLKRQLDVAPGEAPRAGWCRPLCFVLDRCDSTLGVLAVASLLAPVPAATWAWMLALGPLAHLGFSAWLFAVRVKGRAW